MMFFTDSPAIGVVFSNFMGTDIEMSAAIDDRSAVTRAVLRAVFSYPFRQLGCRRITTYADASDRRIADFNSRLGFVLEGRKRAGMPDGDALMFGMLKSECRWIEGNRHG